MLQKFRFWQGWKKCILNILKFQRMNGLSFFFAFENQTTIGHLNIEFNFFCFQLLDSRCDELRVKNCFNVALLYTQTTFQTALLAPTSIQSPESHQIEGKRFYFYGNSDKLLFLKIFFEVYNFGKFQRILRGWHEFFRASPTRIKCSSFSSRLVAYLIAWSNFQLVSCLFVVHFNKVLV